MLFEVHKPCPRVANAEGHLLRRAESFGHLYGHHLRLDSDHIPNQDPRDDRHLTPVDDRHTAAHLDRRAQRRRAEVANAQGPGDAAVRRFAVHWSILGTVERRGGGARAVAVHDRSEQSSVNHARNRRVVRGGGEARHAFLAVPAGLESVAVRVESPTAVAVGEVLGVVILEGGFARHDANGSPGQETRPTCSASSSRRSEVRGTFS